mgnify:FL=1
MVRLLNRKPLIIVHISRSVMACSASVFLVLLRTMNAPAASTSVSVIRELSATDAV